MSFWITKEQRSRIRAIRVKLIKDKYGDDLSRVKFTLVDTKMVFFFKNGAPDFLDFCGENLGAFTLAKVHDNDVSVDVDKKVLGLIREQSVTVEVDNGTDGCFYWTNSTVCDRDSGEHMRSFRETI